MSKEILLTGASAGIGAAAAVELTRRGHRVHAVGRSPQKLARVHRRMTEANSTGVDVPPPLVADFGALRNVSALAETILERCPRLDVLVNNAGVEVHRPTLSEDGFELTFAINHLAPFLLTRLLTERLLTSEGRVVTTASSNHADADLDFHDLQLERGWSSGRAYDRSKLANVIFTAELPRRTGLPATSFHPGSISTDLNRESRFFRLVKPFERIAYGSPREGARTLVWLALEPEGGAPSSTYYVDCRPSEPSPPARDRGVAAGLWARSEAMVSAALGEDRGEPVREGDRGQRRVGGA